MSIAGLSSRRRPPRRVFWARWLISSLVAVASSLTMDSAEPSGSAAAFEAAQKYGRVRSLSLSFRLCGSSRQC